MGRVIKKQPLSKEKKKKRKDFFFLKDELLPSYSVPKFAGSTAALDTFWQLFEGFQLHQVLPPGNGVHSSGSSRLRMNRI